MYLTRVELNGFKSFPDKTAFEFDEGITAILGPNGCGKSNVVDAVKWVLGESRPKQLRSDQMLDVIFAGSERRKPLGLAEVSLTFDNQDGILPIEYNEVCVTRRLYRSGESEYLINKQPCRRRDIRELFMDTGIGTSAYSFIEQGRVEALLHAKPAERRAVFEEAAGISKYKARRKEALSRLDRTHQYLDRVNDIVDEIERSIRRTARHAANARRYQRLKAELDALKGHHYARQSCALQDQRTTIRDERRQIDELLTQETGRQGSTARAIAELTQQEITHSETIRGHEQAGQAIQEKLTQAQVELSACKERLAALGREGSEARNRLTAVRERIAGLDREQAELSASLTARRSEFTSAVEAVQQKEEERTALQGAVAVSDSSIEQARHEVLALSAQRGELQRQVARVESDESTQRQLQRDLESRQAELTTREVELAEAKRALEGELRDAAENLARIEQAMHAARQEEKALLDDAEQYAERLGTLLAERSAKRSRLATLEDLQQSFAGTEAGTKAILEGRASGRLAGCAVEGMVADLVSVPSPVALAIETALGRQAQAIVVSGEADVHQGIRYLKQHEGGRATFLPLDRLQPAVPVGERFRGVEGVLGEAVDLIDYEAHLRPAMECLLAGVLVVGTLEQAQALAKGLAQGLTLVTLSGELVSGYGGVSGGTGQESVTGLITRRAEMDLLGQDLERLGKTIRDVEAGRQQTASALVEVRERLGLLDGEHAALVPMAQELRSQLTVRSSEAERLQEEATGLATDAERLRGVVAGLCAQREALGQEEAGLEAEQTAAEARLAETLAQQREARQALDALGDMVAAVREKRVQAQGAVEAVERRLAAVAADRQDKLEELASLEDVATRADREGEALRTRQSDLQEGEADLLRQRESKREASTALRQRLADVRDQLEEQRGLERATQKRLNEIVEAQNDLKVRENEVSFRIDALTEKARQELGIQDLLQAEATPLVDAEGEPLPAMDAEEEAARIEELAERIERIGPVNLLAIEEQAEMEARAEFLKSEREDLVAASEDLVQVIERLNDECTKRFDETFGRVRENFQEMFRKLFGGGRGDLILEEVEGVEGIDRLDAGIEIIARPPGKEPKSISLLSGGEKALCAVAMLFAIFRSKPSPFCILDEVDGPLDESNIDRFMGAVKEFATDTQFILISHAKRTMSMADTIYGVTQDEPGVSSKYSLRFTQVLEKEAAPVPAAEAASAG